jgi:uncharacterized tellurite resistance protein B-like protein
MLERLRQWFVDGDQAPSDRSGCIKRAVCLLLIAAARSDGRFVADEAREIARTVSRHFGLPADETAELVALAAAEDGPDLYPATRLLREHLDRQQRRDVLLMMWRVVYSDGRLEAREEALMNRAAKLLDVPHKELITLKLTARRDPLAGP